MASMRCVPGVLVCLALSVLFVCLVFVVCSMFGVVVLLVCLALSVCLVFWHFQYV